MSFVLSNAENQQIVLDSSSGPICVTLPNNPNNGQWFHFIPRNENSYTNSTIIEANGQTIVGMPLNVDGNIELQNQDLVSLYLVWDQPEFDGVWRTYQWSHLLDANTIDPTRPI